MILTDNDIDFINLHAADDTSRLLLSASKYPNLNVPFLVEQIIARRQIKDKLPSWYANDRLVFPAKICAEQCSSEQTALYKLRLVEKDWKMCDLTGGLGIDSYLFSRKVQHLTYIERFPAYCDAARDNFAVLNADNITVVNADAATFVNELPDQDLFYIDPARRGDCDKRVYALQDCEPDLPLLLPLLLAKSPRVMAKLSPMADIRKTLELLPATSEIHVISVKNECKELLFVIDVDKKVDSPEVVCINFATEGEEQFSFNLDAEREQNIECTSEIDRYLYEPNASVLKAGAFKEVGARFSLRKLHPSSHLYTSDALIGEFPGRRFEVEEVIPFAGKNAKQLGKQLPKANITVRNFPISVEELRKRLKIADGGNCYLFASTISNGDKVLIKCHKA